MPAAHGRAAHGTRAVQKTCGVANMFLQYETCTFDVAIIHVLNLHVVVCMPKFASAKPSGPKSHARHKPHAGPKPHANLLCAQGQFCMTFPSSMCHCITVRSQDQCNSIQYKLKAIFSQSILEPDPRCLTVRLKNITNASAHPPPNSKPIDAKQQQTCDGHNSCRSLVSYAKPFAAK